MNSVQLIGNLGAAPEINESKGTTYARFRIALNQRWVDGEGKKQQRTDWLTVVAFNGLAKSLAALDKGDQVAVAGRLRSNSYEHEGEIRTSIEVHAQEVDFLRVKKFAKEPAEDETEA
jgi:single-strand DNA-binding protein